MFKYKYVFPLLKAIVYVPFPIKLMSYVSYVQVGRWRNEEGFVMREDSAWEKAALLYTSVGRTSQMAAPSGYRRMATDTTCQHSVSKLPTQP